MDIPEPFLHIIERNYNSRSRENWIRKFINSCFSQLIQELNITNFQTRAKKTGDMFEYIFWFIMKNEYDIELTNDYVIPRACMERGGSLDFGIVNNNKVLCGIEAKGSATEIINSDGTIETLGRPALKRTDTMKKAISQAYQFKRTFPESLFYIVTNVKPESGNSKCMMNLAEGDIVDKFIDITNQEDLNFLVEKLRSILSAI